MPVTKDFLLKTAGELPFADVPVPELGDGAAVRLRVMTGAERDKWDEFLGKLNRSVSGMRAMLVTMCAIEEDGKRMFADADRDAVGKINGIALDRMYWAAWELNKLGAGALDDAAKNSPSETNTGSGSTSPEQSPIPASEEPSV